jgi:hypothetical protein
MRDQFFGIVGFMNASPPNPVLNPRYFTVGSPQAPLYLALTDLAHKRDIVLVNVIQEFNMPKADDPSFMGTAFRFPMRTNVPRSESDVRYIGYYEPIGYEMTCRIVSDFTRVANMNRDILDLRPATIEKLMPYYAKEYPPLLPQEKRNILCYR